ncbi:MAG: FHA domain-containing protein [Polyangiales bacterium]
MRYRLRFHLQEVDLRGDEVVVGRGSVCHVTIDDPMLSRRHARIDLSASEPVIEDLRSRNGTQLNGRPLHGRATLRDGDRIRIGTQELVFLVPSRAKKNFRTTSGLTFCVGCAVPYPSSSPECPHCGAVATVQGDGPRARDVAATGWTFHLLSQVVGRAIEQGRLADAERMLSRGVAELDEQLAERIEVEPARIIGIAECAARLGCALRTPRWLEISAKLYCRAEVPPSLDLLALLDELPRDARIDDAVSALRRAGPETRQAG